MSHTEASAVGSAAAIAADVRAGRRRAVDVMAETLRVIEERNGAVNAFVEARPQEALRAAEIIDDTVRAASDPGPLAGVPVAVKDVIWEADRPATAGSRALLDFVPQQTALTVARLAAAGAIVVGRTNLPEFCYRGDCTNDLYGTTVNPWCHDLTPGGSSGGSAVAAAAGMVPLALGTDGGGSIRIPASFCGVVGLKPSFGLVPRDPGWPGWHGLNHVGPLTNSVSDAALAMHVLAGWDAHDPTTLPVPTPGLTGDSPPRDLRAFRIAYSEDLGYVPVDDEVRETFRATIDRLAELGADLTPAHPSLANPQEIWNTLAFADNVASEGTLLSTGLVGSDARRLITNGTRITGAQYAHARNSQHTFTAAWQSFMQDFDVMLTPAMECLPFPHSRRAPSSVAGRQIVDDDGDDWCHFCYPFNLTGQPALSVPMSPPVSGRPIGLQVAGRRFDDATVLRFAAAWEQAEPWPRPPRTTVAPQLTGSDRHLIDEALRSRRTRIALPPTAHLRAGQRLSLGARAFRVRRACYPADDTLVVELEPASDQRG